MLVKRIILITGSVFSVASMVMSITAICKVNHRGKPPIPHVRHEEPPHGKDCCDKGVRHHKPEHDFKEKSDNQSSFDHKQGEEPKHDHDLEHGKGEKPNNLSEPKHKDDGTNDHKSDRDLEDSNKTKKDLPESNQN